MRLRINPGYCFCIHKKIKAGRVNFDLPKKKLRPQTMYLYWIISLNMVVLDDRLPANLPGGKISKKRPSQSTKAGKVWNSMSKEMRRFTTFSSAAHRFSWVFLGPPWPFPIWFRWISTPHVHPCLLSAVSFVPIPQFLFIFLSFGLAILLSTFFGMII